MCLAKVLDEADKAPIEVLLILKALTEDLAAGTLCAEIAEQGKVGYAIEGWRASVGRWPPSLP